MLTNQLHAYFLLFENFAFTWHCFSPIGAINLPHSISKLFFIAPAKRPREERALARSFKLANDKAQKLFQASRATLEHPRQLESINLHARARAFVRSFVRLITLRHSRTVAARRVKTIGSPCF